MEKRFESHGVSFGVDTGERQRRIAVVGMGYVGLTLATVLAELDFEVIGVEKRVDVVDLTSRGVPHFDELD